VAPAGFELRSADAGAELVEGFGDLALADVAAPAAYETVRVVAIDRNRFAEVDRPTDGVVLADYAAGDEWADAVGGVLDDLAEELDRWFGPPLALRSTSARDARSRSNNGLRSNQFKPAISDPEPQSQPPSKFAVFSSRSPREVAR